MLICFPVESTFHTLYFGIKHAGSHIELGSMLTPMIPVVEYKLVMDAIDGSIKLFSFTFVLKGFPHFI